MRYRKKPVVIEAFCLLKEEAPDWWEKRDDIQVCIHPTDISLTEFKIPTLEGVMTARAGDYIIQGVQGEIYPCKPDIFEATYEAVADDV